MPESSALPLHPGARVSATERDQLVPGLEATFGRDEGSGRGSNDAPGE